MTRKPKKPSTDGKRAARAAHAHAMSKGKQEITVPLVSVGLQNWPPPPSLGSRSEVTARIVADLERKLTSESTTTSPTEECWLVAVEYHACTLPDGTETICRYDYYECDTGRTFCIVTPL